MSPNIFNLRNANKCYISELSRGSMKIYNDLVEIENCSTFPCPTGSDRIHSELVGTDQIRSDPLGIHSDPLGIRSDPLGIRSDPLRSAWNLLRSKQNPTKDLLICSHMELLIIVFITIL